MHDFLLAKQIVDKILDIAKEKDLKNISGVVLEIGSVSLSHDGFPEHIEDISIENLEFGLKNIARNTVLKNADFTIKKVQGEDWKITDIEVE